jgi:nicotinate-nucleotide pyrophosphorylase (carboxylating)
LAEPSPSGDRADAARVAALALAEDGPRDLTTECVLGQVRPGEGIIELRERAVLAGLAYAGAVVGACGLAVTWSAPEGSWLGAGCEVGRVRGDLKAILRAERPLLNLLQRACGIATLTRQFVEALAGTGCRVLHTRKTAPGLRALDVSAVCAGGGGLHRAGLDRAVLIKDNHWQVLGLVGKPLAAVLKEAQGRGCTDLYVEVESLAQVEEACGAGATRILVDNQDPDTLARWAKEARRIRPGITVEATGGITLSNVRQWALAGADYVSVGALTHSVRAVDVALRMA